MPEAVVEYVDGHHIHYEDVIPDHDKRILLIYRNGHLIGFNPYEGILAVMWKEEEEPK